MSNIEQKNLAMDTAVDPDLPKQDAHDIKIIYQPHRLKARIHFTLGDCRNLSEVPTDLFERVRKRLEQAKSQGELEWYHVYDERVARAWKYLAAWVAQNPSTAPTTSVAMTLAQGTPFLKGLDIKATGDPEAPVALSINAPPDTVRGWRQEWVIVNAERVLATDEERLLLNTAQIRGAMHRASQGIPVNNVSIRSLSQISKPNELQSGLAVTHNKSRGEVIAVIWNVAAKDKAALVEEWLSVMEEKLAALASRTDCQFKSLKREAAEALQGAAEGPEYYGFNVPFALLCGVEAGKGKEEHLSQRERTFLKKSPYFTFELSPDDLKATVTAIDPRLYQEVKTINEEWLIAEAKAAGIVHGLREDLIAAATADLAAKNGTKGMIIALGEASRPGQEPYLCDLASGNLSDGESQASIRQYRSQVVVKANQLVAEIRYKQPPVIGRGVSGKALPAPKGEDLSVTVGEGIERRGDGGFYAMRDGIFAHDAASGIHLKSALVHQGDVNLASGNIDFDGPVEITGNIDSGVTVAVGGDLVVGGEIRGGIVRCGGSVKVAHGIVSGENGMITVEGDIEADFIENATIDCGGVLKAEKSILASYITAAKGIEVTSASGIICGGSLTCGDFLKTSRLGIDDGAKTFVNVGLNIKAELAYTRKTKRLEAFIKLSQEERTQLKELTRKNPAQLTKANKDAKARLTQRISKIKRLIDLAQKAVQAAEKKRQGNPAAKIIVSGTLSSNCQLRVSGVAIPLTREWNGAIVHGTPAEDGSYIASATSFDLPTSKPDKVAG